jgi:transposase
LIGQRTQLINALRARLAEFGLVAEADAKESRSLSRSSRTTVITKLLPSAMKKALQGIVD